MSRAFRSSAALAAALALAGLSVQSARADLYFSAEHDDTYTIDPIAAQVLYSASDTVTTNAAGSTGNYTVNVFGDTSTFSWNGANGLTVSGVSTTATTGSATLTSNGAPGTSGYGYLSNDGQGILSGSGTTVNFTGVPLQLSDSAATLVESIGILGDFTPSAATIVPGSGISFTLDNSSNTITNLQIGDRYNVSNLFVFDPTFGLTRFDATAAAPEPGTVALFAGMALSGMGFAARLRRRAR